MKIKKLIPAIAFMVILAGCGNEKTSEIMENENPKQETSQTVDEDKNAQSNGIIYTSFYPIYNLSKQIAGDKWEIRSFTNLKTESHGWEPSAKDIAELSNASLMIINGAGMEEWEDSVDDSTDIEILDTTSGLDLLEAKEEYNHNHDDHEENHEHENEDEHNHEHNHGKYDPHTWLSPKNAIYQAKLITDKLISLDADNKDYYKNNYEKLEKELTDLINDYEKKFADVDSKNFVVNHKAFSYLAHDFDLNQIALTEIASTDDQGAKDLKELVDLANELNISTIFYEKGTDGKSAKTIAEEIGADTNVLNTLEFATDEDLTNGRTYQDLMKENLEALYQSMIK